MSDINKVIIRGRAAANAEWKDLPNTTLVTLRVATSDDYTDRDGRKVERTDWHMVACWGRWSARRSHRRTWARQALNTPRMEFWAHGSEWLTTIDILPLFFR